MSGRSKLSGGKGKVSTQQAITGFLVKAAEKQTIKVKVGNSYIEMKRDSTSV
jgi:hypothetical protein